VDDGDVEWALPFPKIPNNRSRRGLNLEVLGYTRTQGRAIFSGFSKIPAGAGFVGHTKLPGGAGPVARLFPCDGPANARRRVVTSGLDFTGR